TNVPESNMLLLTVNRYGRSACDLGEGSPVLLKLARRGWSGFKFEAGKLTMHLAARTYALDDLLADVAAFIEVERLHLFRLLRQVFVTDVLTILWDSVRHAPPLQGLSSHHARSRLGLKRKHALPIRRRPNFVPARLVLRAAHNRDFGVVEV